MSGSRKNKSGSRKNKRPNRPLAEKPASTAIGTEQVRGERVLEVVTVVLLTSEDFPGELGESYQHACTAVGVQATDRGWGLVLTQDEDGARWTQVTTDVDGIGQTLAIWNSGLDASYQAPPHSISRTRPGWPIECSLGYADRKPPHDPGNVASADLLRPATGRGWTPAKRRAMADELAEELTHLQHRSRNDYIDAYRFDMSNLGDFTLHEPPARIIDMLIKVEPSSPPVEDALAQAWSLAAAAKPPPGSIRIRKATHHARMIRATGHQWTLVARTDGPVVLLLDQAPGAALQIDADATELSSLLDALTAAADRVSS